jgi:hypothetical protein
MPARLRDGALERLLDRLAEAARPPTTATVTTSTRTGLSPGTRCRWAPAGRTDPRRPASAARQQRRADFSYPCVGAVAPGVAGCCPFARIATARSSASYGRVTLVHDRTEFTMRAAYGGTSGARLPDSGERALFSLDARRQRYLDVEAALAAAQAEFGLVPPAAAAAIAASARLELLGWAAPVIRTGPDRARNDADHQRAVPGRGR